jgi:non-homologous end joining protein Ku
MNDELKWKHAIRKKGIELGHYNIPVKLFNQTTGKNIKYIKNIINSIVQRRIKELEFSINYNKDIQEINNLIKKWKLEIEILPIRKAG